MPEPMTRHLTDEELLLDFYDEGTAVDRTRVRTHLEHCEQCRALDQELRCGADGSRHRADHRAAERLRARDVGADRAASARSADVAHPLERDDAATGRRRQHRHSRGGSVHRWSGVGAADIPRPQGASMRPDSERTTASRRGRGPPRTFATGARGTGERRLPDRSPDRGRSGSRGDLVAAGRLSPVGGTTGDSEIGGLLEDLERVLVEVANGPADIAPEELTRLRQRIDDQDLVFRVRVVAREIKETGMVDEETDG